MCTPLFAAVLLRNRIGPVTWAAVALAMAGLGGAHPAAGSRVGYGEALTLVAALIYALHIVGLGAWIDARGGDGHVDRAAGGDHAVVCVIGAAPDGIELPSDGRDWLSRGLHGGVRRGAGDGRRRPGRRRTCPPTRARSS